MKAVELIDITKKYGEQEVLNSFSLDVEKGKCLAIMGESGSGKSTIAKIIIGLEKQNSGTVEIFDKDIEFLFQDSYNALNPRMTVEDLIYEPLQFLADINVKKKKEIVSELLEQVELSSELLTRKRDELSGGQLQRVCLARALSTKPQIMIFDESLSGLDPLVQDKILDLLYKIQKQYQLTYIFISHDFRLCYFLADRIILIDKGKIIEDFKEFDLESFILNELKEKILQIADSPDVVALDNIYESRLEILNFLSNYIGGIEDYSLYMNDTKLAVSGEYSADYMIQEQFKLLSVYNEYIVNYTSVYEDFSYENVVNVETVWSESYYKQVENDFEEYLISKGHASIPEGYKDDESVTAWRQQTADLREDFSREYAYNYNSKGEIGGDIKKLVESYGFKYVGKSS